MKCSVFRLPVLRPRTALCFLVLCFLAGHVFGICLSRSADEAFYAAMRTVASCHISLIGALSSAALPFLFSAFAVYLRQPLFLFPIAFLKAFLFSYVSYGLFAVWGSAGWLICGLTLFASVGSMPVLWWYWLRHIDRRQFEILPFGTIMGILLFIGMLDFYLIAPFLDRIIIF